MNAQSSDIYEKVLLQYNYWINLRPARKEKLTSWIEWWDNRRKCWSNVSNFIFYSLFLKHACCASDFSHICNYIKYILLFQAYRNQVSGRTNLAEAGNSRYRGTTMLTKLPISQGTQAMYKVNLHDLK